MSVAVIIALLLGAADASAAVGAQINGGGAPVPYPVYSRWLSDYRKLHPDVEITYQSIGSGAGIRGLLAGALFFAGTDGPMTREQMQAMPGGVLHFPTLLHAVVPIYNLPDNPELRFSGRTLADIVLGRVTKWDDSAIAVENPGVRLPAADIKPILQLDGSGTTYILIDYLAKVAPDFKARVGIQTAITWPVNYVSHKSSEGVAGQVRALPGAIGFLEFSYALANKMQCGMVRNFDGEFVRASTTSLTAAGAAATPYIRTTAADYRVSITNAPGRGAYAMASFSWLVLPRVPTDRRKARAMAAFLEWALTDGQDTTVDLGYAPLPAELRALECEALHATYP
ncbi:MAG TPA: phosphate ABC transporter substrate-binding protein PstS [Candidatus Binatia bacterium]|nr:phosphate ABC transporter substrate-binding protein PstS [Candidatus Binatia bacterium]